MRTGGETVAGGESVRLAGGGGGEGGGGAGEVGAQAVERAGGGRGARGAKPVGGVAGESATVANGVPAPVIKDISVSGGNVYITITSTKPAYKYTLESGDTPGEVAEADGAKWDYGSETTDVILVKPVKAGGEFFKVNCK